MRAAARAASSLANNRNPPSRAARRRGRIERRGWKRKGVVAVARDIIGATVARRTSYAIVVVVVVIVAAVAVLVGSHYCRLGLPIIGAAPGGTGSPQSSTWRLAGAAGFRGVWRAGPRHGIPVPRA